MMQATDAYKQKKHYALESAFPAPFNNYLKMMEVAFPHNGYLHVFRKFRFDIF